MTAKEVALTAKVPYDMGPDDCNEEFKALNGETVVCNRPKGHDGKHWKWIGDRVWYFEFGYIGNLVIKKKPGGKRF